MSEIEQQQEDWQQGLKELQQLPESEYEAESPALQPPELSDADVETEQPSGESLPATEESIQIMEPIEADIESPESAGVIEHEALPEEVTTFQLPDGLSMEEVSDLAEPSDVPDASLSEEPTEDRPPTAEGELPDIEYSAPQADVLSDIEPPEPMTTQSLDDVETPDEVSFSALSWDDLGDVATMEAVQTELLEEPTNQIDLVSDAGLDEISADLQPALISSEDLIANIELPELQISSENLADLEDMATRVRSPAERFQWHRQTKNFITTPDVVS